MATRYRLADKIKALNLVDSLDGDRTAASAQLSIPAKTLQKWTAAENELRANFSDYQKRHFDRLLPELHVTMLERAVAVVKHLDDAKLAEASASQLAYTLNILANHIVKLQEFANAASPEPETPQPAKMELPPRPSYADEIHPALSKRYTNLPTPAPATTPYADEIAPLPNDIARKRIRSSCPRRHTRTKSIQRSVSATRTSPLERRRRPHTPTKLRPCQRHRTKTNSIQRQRRHARTT